MSDGYSFDDIDLEGDLDRAETVLSIRTERRRYGKPVTIIEGFGGSTDLRALASRLKKRLGTGGTVEGKTVELQGDHRGRLPALLEAEGFAVE